MGTRADFWIGRDKSATWLGSVGMDGMPPMIGPLLGATFDDVSHAGVCNRHCFIEAVAFIFTQHDEHTVPGQGWPWPWKDSNTTDYAYAWDEDKVWVSWMGRPWHVMPMWMAHDADVKALQAGDTGSLDLPDMTAIMKVRYDTGNAPMIFGVRPDGHIGLVNDEVDAAAQRQELLEHERREAVVGEPE